MRAECVCRDRPNAGDLEETVFEVHAESDYREFGLAAGLTRRGAVVEVPAAHLSQGAQLAFYSHRDTRVTPNQHDDWREHGASGRSVYTPLGQHLAGLFGSVEGLSLMTIERILGRPLPACARKHRAWWSNESDRTHRHARAWMDQGWLVHAIDLGGESTMRAKVIREPVDEIRALRAEIREFGRDFPADHDK